MSQDDMTDVKYEQNKYMEDKFNQIGEGREFREQ
jgi:hypothetical protein